MPFVHLYYAQYACTMPTMPVLCLFITTLHLLSEIPNSALKQKHSNCLFSDKNELDLKVGHTQCLAHSQDFGTHAK